MNNYNNNNTNLLTAANDAAPVADFAAIEEVAAAAQYVNSFSEYKPGTATAEITNAIEEARENLKVGLARCATDKQRDDLSAKFESYKKKIVSYYAAYYRNEAACPSVLICGSGNFPTAKKNKQNARRDSLREEWQQLESLKNSLRGGYSIAISSDDPQALEALQKKLQALKDAHAFKVAANTYFRKNKTFKGMDGLTDEAAEKLDNDARNAAARMGGRCEPFPAWSLSNENAEIKRLEKRIEELQERKENNTLTGWNFAGGRVEIDAENNRIGVYFDERTTGAALDELYKNNGDTWLPRLLWSPRFQRWQCQNNAANIRRLQNSKTFAPSDEESKKAIEEAKQERQQRQEAKAQEEAKAKEEKQAKRAETFNERAAKLQEKQNELKKIGFVLKPGVLAYVNNNISEYMKAGHGIRRKIRIDGSNKLLLLEISFNKEWSDRKEKKYINVSISEAEAKENAVISGSGFMACDIKIRELPDDEKRQLATLQKLAEQYKPETDDARIIALYNAYKSRAIPSGRKWFDDGNRLDPEQAREFLENWKPEEDQEQQQEPKQEHQEPQEQAPQERKEEQHPEQEQEQPTPPPYLSIKGEQLYLF